MSLDGGVKPEVFVDRLTPLRFSRLLCEVLAENPDASAWATLRHLHARRAFRFGASAMPPAAEAEALMENWLEHQLPQLSAEDLDMTEGLRMLSERLAFRRVLATSWWDRVHLEIPLACGTPIHWLLEHEAGRVTHAAVHLQAPEAPLRLRMSARNVARFYCVDGSSGLQLLARAAGLLGTLELIEGRQRPSPHTAFQALRRALLGA